MALLSTFLLSNIDSSLLFNYRFPTLEAGSSGVTDGGGEGRSRGQMLPWQLRCGPLFRNGAPLQLPVLLKQFYML